MKIRQKFWPRTFVDCLGVGFILSILPVAYWFEISIVLPLYYESSPKLYVFQCVVATVILFGIVSNYIAVILVDTSTRGVIIPSNLKPTWWFCPVCESVSPPRSWHCESCEGCILKRDHHCLFTACCIGHWNHRYFLLFLVYISLGSLYCAWFNGFYLWRVSEFRTLRGLLKIFLPLAVYLFGNDTSLLQLYRIIAVVTLVGTPAALTLCIVYCHNTLKGVTMYEYGKKITDYDMGSALENIKLVLGERWYLTIIWPFVTSKIPHDGIHWDELKLQHDKSK